MPPPDAFKTLQDLEQSACPATFPDEERRRRAVQLAQSLLSKIESPWETAARYFLIDPVAVSALKTLHDLNLFARWEPVESRKSVGALSELTNCEERLMSKY